MNIYIKNFLNNFEILTFHTVYNIITTQLLYQLKLQKTLNFT